MKELEELCQLLLDIEISYIEGEYWLYFNIEGRVNQLCGPSIENVVSRALAGAHAYGPERCKTKI